MLAAPTASKGLVAATMRVRFVNTVQEFCTAALSSEREIAGGVGVLMLCFLVGEFCNVYTRIRGGQLSKLMRVAKACAFRPVGAVVGACQYIALEGVLDPEPDTQSPFFDGGACWTVYSGQQRLVLVACFVHYICTPVFFVI
jgi:hypothetical protein